MTVGLGVVSITHPACVDGTSTIGTSYPSLRVERAEESFIIICLKDKNVNNPGYRPGNNVTSKLNPAVG
jgi:hypothetical protein